MKRLYIIGLLLLFIGIALYLRIALPYDQVFTGEWIKFISVDAYSQMGQVDKIAPDFPHYVSQIFHIPFFNWLLSAVIWCIGLGSPTQHTIDTVAVYFPAILGGLTIIPVYGIGKVMVGRLTGVTAAGLIAILPGEWLGRSSLGFTDHHVAEVLFSTTAIMFLVMMVKATGRRRIIYGLLTGLFMYIYWLTWNAALLFVLIIFTSLAIKLWSVWFHSRNYLGLVWLTGGASIGIVLLYGPAIFLLPSGGTALATMELMPFTPLRAWANFGMGTFLIPIILMLLIYQVVKYSDTGTLLLVVWSLIIMLLTLNYTRFAYYFAINVALLTGWFVSYVWQRLSKADVLKAIMVTTFLCILLVLPNIQQATTNRAYFAPSDAWCETLSWVEDNTPEDSLILAWWDYGYWISHIAQRKAYITPGQWPDGITNTANMFLSPSEENLIEADYLILDFETVTSKLFGITIWADVPIEDYYIKQKFSQKYYNSLMARLYFDSELNPVGQYELVYESKQKIEGKAEVKVFKKRWIKDIGHR